ncbi:MAG: MFS transporter [Spirochaetes bacterium]|nr:MFS transporter [Spirochaetota bacterium]
MGNTLSKLSLKTKLGYGVCDVGGNLFFTVTAFVLMNYLTDTVGLAAGLAGTALMIGRIWDAFYDPVIGYISDRTRSTMGRRRPYLLAGSIPLFITMIFMFLNPAMFMGGGWQSAANQTFLFIWVTVIYMLLCTSYSTVNIPYNAMVPELTQDFHERTSLNGFRFGFAAIGTLLGAGVALPLVGMFADKTVGFAALGAIFGGAMMITALLTVILVREPAKLRPAESMGILKTYRTVFKNKPYLLILLAYVFHIMGITILSGIAIYYFKYILNHVEGTNIALPILIITALTMIPVSVILSKKIGKKLVYAIGLLIKAFALMIIFFYGHVLGINFMYGMMFFTGIGFGFTYAMPFAIVPDAIEYDYLKTGERREGAFYSIWTWGFKIGQAFAIFVMGWILSLSGYVENVAQTPSAQLGIRLFLGPIPAAILAAGALVLYFYPINEERYRDILRQIKEMEEKKQV